MKQQLLYLFAATLICASCKNEKKSDENKEKATSENKVASAEKLDSATIAKNYQDYATPGEMHKMMASWDGTWDENITMWEKPGAPPMTNAGTVTNKMVLNGLYQESVHTGNMMGMPFEGHGTLAYDNAKKMFVSTWIDNMGSGIMLMEGPWDPATKSCTLKGKAYEPSTGQQSDFKEVFTAVDDKNQTLEMYGPGPDGKEWKIMEIKYVRK